ncbi:MAG: hypothetical protein JW789_00200 [Candidatus Aenigmarchaeota archaeon]|nr:hypothetical protein [Candidatus Aenigmarchaeota archaeon]
MNNILYEKLDIDPAEVKKITAVCSVASSLREKGLPCHITERVYRNLPDSVAAIGPSTPGYQCNDYALGSLSILAIDEYALKEGDTPKAGDIVVYESSLPLENFRPTHVGVLQEDGTVISKWGSLPLMKHEKSAVVEEYIDTDSPMISFARIPSGLLRVYREMFSMEMLSGYPLLYDPEEISWVNRDFINHVYGKLPV